MTLEAYCASGGFNPLTCKDLSPPPPAPCGDAGDGAPPTGSLCGSYYTVQWINTDYGCFYTYDATGKLVAVDCNGDGRYTCAQQPGFEPQDCTPTCNDASATSD